MCVLHKCDNPPCVNPNHLFAGTKGENNSDRDRKMRHQHGMKHWKAKLTDSDIPVIRQLLQDERLTLSDIGRRYGVTYQTICAIRDGQTWTHVS